MSITVRYFASLADLTGSTQINVPLETPAPVHSIWNSLHPELDLPLGTLVSINLEYVTLDSQVNPGDELAFFPLVTGG